MMCPRCMAPNEDSSSPVSATNLCTNCGWPGEDRSTVSVPTISEQLRAKHGSSTGERQFVTMMQACIKSGVSMAFIQGAVESEAKHHFRINKPVKKKTRNPGETVVQKAKKKK